jgi:hypothetical protein
MKGDATRGNPADAAARVRDTLRQLALQATSALERWEAVSELAVAEIGKLKRSSEREYPVHTAVHASSQAHSAPRLQAPRSCVLVSLSPSVPPAPRVPTPAMAIISVLDQRGASVVAACRGHVVLRGVWLAVTAMHVVWMYHAAQLHRAIGDVLLLHRMHGLFPSSHHSCCRKILLG